MRSCWFCPANFWRWGFFQNFSATSGTLTFSWSGKVTNLEWAEFAF